MLDPPMIRTRATATATGRDAGIAAATAAARIRPAIIVRVKNSFTVMLNPQRRLTDKRRAMRKVAGGKIPC
jgi:hypothetical protein